MKTTFQLEEIKRKTINTPLSEQFYNLIDNSQKDVILFTIICGGQKVVIHIKDTLSILAVNVC